MHLTWQHFAFDLSKRTHIMGILNVTPDSFSDGGQHFSTAAAVDCGLRMADEGADILDIGGESTRPGSDPVPLEEEIRRTIPVIGALSGRIRIPISIDTCKAEVARRAIDAGASLVNDVSGLRADPDMPGVVAACRVPVVLMHMKGKPKDMQHNPRYAALIPELMDYFRTGIRTARAQGIAEDMIIIDPGIGFGKTFDHNLEIIRNLQEFTLLGRPLLVGPSRKAFIGRILGDVPAQERLEGTAAVIAVAIMNGANIVRVHDVREMVRVVKVADAILRGRVDS